MRRSWCFPILWAVVVAAAPVLAVGAPTPEEVQVNRRLLERWRADPEHYARLKRDYRAFIALPAEKRERLREIDHELHEEDSTTQARLMRVLDRYATWLDRLSEEDRARVDAAADGPERLRVVKELREREWISRQPRADQERIRSAPPDQQPKVVAELRQEERNRRREWQVAFWSLDEPGSRPANPTRANEFPRETQFYIAATLVPMLGYDERLRLRQAEGKWPDYAHMIWQLSQEHQPVKFPPAARPVPTKPFDYRPGDIPDEILRLMRMRKQGDQPSGDRRYANRLQKTIGKWPDFPLAIAEVAREKNIPLKKPLGPCTLEELHPLVRDFYSHKMATVLQKGSEDELDRLRKASGTWPEYPNLFMELAQKHHLQVPGTYLAGEKDFWESVQVHP